MGTRAPTRNERAEYLQGNVLCVGAVDSDTGRKVVSDRGCKIAVNELHKDGVGMGKGGQVIMEKNRRVEKGVRGA